MEPPLNVRGLPLISVLIPTGEAGDGGAAISEIFPEGVPEAAETLTVKLALVPCATVPLGDAVIDGVSATNDAELQAFNKFPTFTEPSPVALSYPATAAKAGVVVLAGSTRTPN